MLLVLGTLALAIAALASLALVGIGLSGGSNRDGGRAMAVMMLALPYAGGLLAATACAIARGGFDWVLPSHGSGARWSLVLLTVVAAVVIALGCAALKGEPPGQVPWALRPLVGWGVLLWPPLLLAAVALALYPGLRLAWPAPAWQLPQLVMGVASLAVGAALVVSLVHELNRQQRMRLQAELDYHDRRDDSMLKKVQDADPEQDFLSLLPHSSQHEQPAIRELALAKLRALPDLDQRLQRTLRSRHAEEAFRFLASNDANDPRAMAEAVREGISEHARELHHSISNTHTLRPDDYLHPVLDILATLDRLPAPGVDARAALQQLRNAFDAPRDYAQKTPAMQGQRAVDEWLRRH
jgi:hypothetical protein